MATITNGNLLGRELIITLETRPGTRAKKYIVSYDDASLFEGVKTGKTPVAKGTPAAGGATREPGPYEIRNAREEAVGRFYFHAQEVKSKGGKLYVNEMLRSLSTYEITNIELVSRDKIVF